MEHFIKVKEIELNSNNSGLCESYPESGFWLVKIGSSRSDLRFVDKQEGSTLLICPEYIYKAMGIDTVVLQEKEGINNMSTYINTPSGYVSEDFVMNYAKLLLNSKSKGV